MRIAIVDLWTDANRGDAALQLSLIQLVKERYPGSRVTGIYRFGYNEIAIAMPEIGISSSALDVVLGGPRLTFLAGQERPWQKSVFRRTLANLYSLSRFLGSLLLFLLLRGWSRPFIGRGSCDAFSAVSKADLVVWKGKNFREYGSRQTLTRALSLSLNILPALALRKNVICVNASFWPIKHVAARRYYRMIFGACSLVVVRESASLEAARELLPQHHNLVRAPDLSFKVLAATVSGLPSPVNWEQRRMVAGLTMTKWGNSELQRTCIRELCEAIVKLDSLGFEELRIIPQVVRERESNTDNLKELLELCRARHLKLAIRVIEEQLEIEGLLNQYAQCRLLIGMRMHSCVFARMVGTPFVAIAYDEGAKWSILSELHPPEMVVPLSQVAVANLPALVARVALEGGKMISEGEATLKTLIANVSQNMPARLEAPV